MRSPLDRLIRCDDEDPEFMDDLYRRAGWDCCMQWVPENLIELEESGIAHDDIEVTERLLPFYAIRIWVKGHLKREWSIMTPGAAPEAVKVEDELDFFAWLDGLRTELFAEGLADADLRFEKSVGGTVEVSTADGKIARWQMSTIRKGSNMLPIDNRLGRFFVPRDEVVHQTDFSLAVLAGTRVMFCQYNPEFEAYEYIGLNRQFDPVPEDQNSPVDYEARWNEDPMLFDVQPIVWRPAASVPDEAVKSSNVVALKVNRPEPSVDDEFDIGSNTA